MIEFSSSDAIKQEIILVKKSTGERLNIPTDGSATLTAFVADTKRNKKIIDEAPILHTSDGNDWANGVCVAEFDASSAAALAKYDGDIIWLAVRVIINSKPKTLKAEVKAVKMPV